MTLYDIFAYTHIKGQGMAKWLNAAPDTFSKLKSHSMVSATCTTIGMHSPTRKKPLVAFSILSFKRFVIEQTLLNKLFSGGETDPPQPQ